MGEVRVGLGSCCMAKGSGQLFRELEKTVLRDGLPVTVKRVGCVGMCHRTPIVEVVEPSKKSVFYARLSPSLASGVLRRHFKTRNLLRRAEQIWADIVSGIVVDQPFSEKIDRCRFDGAQQDVSAFLQKQVHIATEHFAELDPIDLDEYLAHDGFAALARCLGVQIVSAPSKNNSVQALTPEQIIDLITRSGLRGRGGAGFPTGEKWRLVRAQSSDKKYVICNGDEGDPGAFMDRMLLESFPFRVIEGIAIAAVAVGAHEGVFYIRHEYPLAVRRMRAAMGEMEKRGWLGKTLLGSGYELNLSVMEGAGAFVCGEETALIASIEGRRGMPRLRPPYPAESGLWGCPTLINNVETLAVVPWIVRHGAEAFAQIGTATSKGTKVFALAGRVQRAGLIEVPMGTTIREIVEGMGGGAPAGHRFKAVQIGGPSGGCVPARLADTPIDYESLQQAGAIMGSGGLVVLDDSTCIVDIARYFLKFTQEQSCGKCTFCRVGTRRMLETLDRICSGKGRHGDLGELEHLATVVSRGSLCGLGKTAPNPVLSTLRYFRDEYEAHINGRCPAKKCVSLIHYVINDRCTGCTLCAQRCPVNAIPMKPYERHKIDDSKCTRCDSCRQVCRYSAIDVL
ncbi:MAG: NADH-quinone oxidoreductase subunit NuoF [Verrucomicrobiae bacterium]|nr:NADH-quinone oxidoreductase subunit NuoF [Verrucomicrobiae bacterium]